MKKITTLTILMAALLGQSAYAEQLTQKQALQVLDILMSAKKVTNTYGGKYSAVTHNLDKIELYKVGRYFEIVLLPNAPDINIKDILVDGVPLATKLAR